LVSGAEFALEFLAGERTVPSAAAAALGSMRPAADEAIREICDAELPSRAESAASRSSCCSRCASCSPPRRAGPTPTRRAAAWYLATEPATARELLPAARASAVIAGARDKRRVAVGKYSDNDITKAAVRFEVTLGVRDLQTQSRSTRARRG
jgi:hypothetical protein